MRTSSLFTLLSAALVEPRSLSLDQCASLVPALTAEGPTERALARGTLAAIAITRPELVGAAHTRALMAGLDGDPSGFAAARAILEGLAASPDPPDGTTHEETPARLAAAAIWQLFRAPRAPGSATLRSARIDLLLHLALWRPDLVDLDSIVDVAPELDSVERERCLGEIVGPHLTFDASRLAAVGAAEVARLDAAFASSRQWPYAVSLLAQRPGATPALLRAAGAAASRFEHKALATEVLSRPRFRLLVVHNVRVGQGDELVRIGPLLQALLAANPSLEATVITARPYLYEHPRVEAIPIHDAAATTAAIAAPFDGLFDVFEPRVSEVNLRLDLEERVAERAAAARPSFLLRSSVGYGHFVFEQVTIGGRELTDLLGLRRRTVVSAYACARQLVLELGLPWLPAALAGGCGGDADPFTARPSSDAARIWSELAGNGARPVALVWPFGGHEAVKGYSGDRVEVLAGELADLVEEGYRAVVLPPGERWAGSEVLDRLRGALPPPARAHVAIAPDPAAPSASAETLALTEAALLRHADRVMRLFKHFAARADLIVTIEGWLGHLAAQLGRPTRVVLMAGSYSPDWYARGDNVRFAGMLSSCAPREPGGVLATGAPPPLPRRAQRGLLEASLIALRHAPDEAAELLLRRGLESPVFEVRAAALWGLDSRCDRPAILDLVIASLDDPESKVRAAASGVLLGAAARGVAVRVKRDLLQAHRLIAIQAWDQILAMGDAALPALAIAAASDNEVVRREARWMMGGLLARRLARSGPTSRTEPC